MTDPLYIPLTRDRAVWLFAIDLPEAGIDAFLAGDLAAALGTDSVDKGQIEVLDTDTIRVIGLATYLTEANAMDEAMVAPDAAMLDALKGHLLLVFRAALGPGGTALAPQAPLRFIGHYAEPMAAAPEPMATPEAAKGVLEGPPARRLSDAATGGRVATAVLIFLFLFTALFVWMAGR